MKRIIVLCFCIAMLLFILPADAETFWKMHWKPGENIISFTPEEDAQITAVIEEATQESEGTNIRFVVTKNRNNSAETIYKRYCGRGEMELWIKDLKYFKADRMSCNSYRANYFRLFLYAAAFVLAHKMKHTVFRGTEVERFTMDSLIKRIMLSAVYIVEKKTYIKISFSPHHRHREELETALTRMAA